MYLFDNGDVHYITWKYFIASAYLKISNQVSEKVKKLN